MAVIEQTTNEKWIVIIEHAISEGEVTLEDRIEWASRLFAVPPYSDAGDGEDSLVDILTDLQHYAHANDIDFTRAFNRASEHYGFEREQGRQTKEGGGR